MKLAVIAFILLAFLTVVQGQNIKLSGTVYDPNGAVVPRANVKVTDKSGHRFKAITNDEGSFLLALIPGLYTIEIERPGFTKLIYKEYRIVDSTFGKMNIDFVIFGSSDHEPCGYTGADCLNPGPIEVKEMPSASDKISPRPQIVENKKETVGKTRYCMTVTDDVGAFISKASIRFSPTKQSRSRIKYEFMTDQEGAIDVKVVDGIYDITIKALTYKKIVLKNQLLPYDPRDCVEVRLRSAIPPHQIT